MAKEVQDDVLEMIERSENREDSLTVMGRNIMLAQRPRQQGNLELILQVRETVISLYSPNTLNFFPQNTDFIHNPIEANKTASDRLVDLAHDTSAAVKTKAKKLEDSLMTVYEALLSNTPVNFSSQAEEKSILLKSEEYLDMYISFEGKSLWIKCMPRDKYYSIFEITVDKEILMKQKPRFPFFWKKPEMEERINYEYSITINNSQIKSHVEKAQGTKSFTSFLDLMNYAKNQHRRFPGYFSILAKLAEIPEITAKYLKEIKDFVEELGANL